MEDNRNSCLDFNVLIGSTTERDKDLFFGPLTGSEVWVHADSAHLAVILADLGLFPSAGQARKNGWAKKAAPGFSEFVIGKLKTKVTILNISDE